MAAPRPPPPNGWVPPTSTQDYMSDAHVMDFSTLNAGHPAVSVQTMRIADLEFHVHGLEEMGSELPVAVLFLTHGFANKARQFERMAAGILGEVGRLENEGKRRTRDLLIVTLDQPNHGGRRRFKDKGTFDNSANRMIGFASGITYGMLDQQYLMDYLPAFLFPRDERQIVEWMACGMSMGGHQTWRLLRDDPRVTIGIPITALPPERLKDLFTRRLSFGVSVPETHFPAGAVRKFFELCVPAKHYGEKGCKILTLHGELDEVIPPSLGEPRFGEIKAASPPGTVEQWIHPGKGHVITPEMTVKTAQWIWRWGLQK